MMTDYKKMYLHLFNTMSTVIQDFQNAQRNCEEMVLQEEQTFEIYPQDTKTTKNKSNISGFKICGNA